MAEGQQFADFTDKEFEELLAKWFYPNIVDWLGIPIFLALFVIGLTGNFLVVFVVLRNATMRTVTNIFLVNLALADFLVLVFCLPLSVLWDTTRTWWFGTAMCKALLYLQNLSVTVSVLTLVCISVERWYAICSPLKFVNTFQRTRNALVSVWVLSLLLSLPESLTLKAKSFDWTEIRSNFSTTLGTTCSDTWGEETQKTYQIIQTVVLFVIPLSIITIMYGQIAFDLWLKSTPPSDECHFDNSTTLCDGTALKLLSPQDHKFHGERSKPIVNPQSGIQTARNREIMNRRKAAKMLIAVVILFVICYLPVHVYNILKTYGLNPSLSPTGSSAVTLACRSLTYFNSCINPIIYNFMSEKFQKEFSRACPCLPRQLRNIPSWTSSPAPASPARRQKEKSDFMFV